MSGVPDQMKVLGTTAKNSDDRKIPWSQQVNEASFENLASVTTTTDDNTVNLTSMQFQYPPFNAKETQNVSWNNYKSIKKYGKPAFYSNNVKRDDFQSNAWNMNNSRRVISDVSGRFTRPYKSDESYENEKLDNRPYDNLEEKRQCAPPPISVPKKTTWASIASQPAKLTSRSTLSTSTHKKKGPGMPPPPMVPGKHNLDVNTWDLPNNNPPPVPSPPPIINHTYPEINQDVPVNSGGVSLDCSSFHPEMGNKGSSESSDKDEKKMNYISSNFGRIRTSPNGHSRKNWQTPPPPPLHQNRPTGAVGPMRRSENIGTNRYNNERKSYNNTRFEQDNSVVESRDEREFSVRNTERVGNMIETPLGDSSQTVLEELRDKNNYNPSEIDLEKATLARFFVIKSYSEDDIHRSIKYEIWCSTDHGNKRLDDAFKERQKEWGHVLLFFSVNGSGHFCGMAQMMTAVDYNSTSSVWSQDKWKGKFKVKWIYVKDVPNAKLKHIRLENNDNKPVTNSRDTQEVPNSKGIDVLQILHSYKHSTSIFDDFYHYEKKQEEEVSSKRPIVQENMTVSQSQLLLGRNMNRQSEDRDRERSGGQQKYFNTGSNFRERNSLYRGGSFQTNYSDNRRFDNHNIRGGGGGNSDYLYKDREDVDREENEHGGRKFEYRSQHSKHNNRDYSEEQNKSELPRFRVGQRDNQKDNEYQSERIRGVDY